MSNAVVIIERGNHAVSSSSNKIRRREFSFKRLQRHGFLGGHWSSEFQRFDLKADHSDMSAPRLV